MRAAPPRPIGPGPRALRAWCGLMTSTDESPSLRRTVTTTGLFLFILGDVLGAGVYVLAGEIAGIAGGALWVPLVVALLLALLTAGSYAELATKYPKAGGSSHYATRAFGPFTGFLVGFCMLSAGIVSVGTLALGFAGDYLGAFVSLPAALVVLVFLALLAALNMCGSREQAARPSAGAAAPICSARRRLSMASSPPGAKGRHRPGRLESLLVAG